MREDRAEHDHALPPNSCWRAAITSASSPGRTVRGSRIRRSCSTRAMIGTGRSRSCLAASVGCECGNVQTNVGRVSAGSEPPPIADSAGSTSPASTIARHCLSALPEMVGFGRDHAPDRDRFDGLAEEVVLECGAESGDGGFVESEHAHQGMGAEPVDRGLPADDQAGLGSAEELVAAEEDEVGAGFDAVLRSWFVSESELSRVEQTTAADIVDQQRRESPRVLVGDLAEFGQGRFLGESDDAEVGGVHSQDCRRVSVHGCGVVGCSSAVGGADFDKGRSGVAEDVGNAEAAADLDGLASRDDHFASRAKRGHDEVERGGVVVDGDGGLGAGQGLEQGLQVVGA